GPDPKCAYRRAVAARRRTWRGRFVLRQSVAGWLERSRPTRTSLAAAQRGDRAAEVIAGARPPATDRSPIVAELGGEVRPRRHVLRAWSPCGRGRRGRRDDRGRRRSRGLLGLRG